MKNLICKTKRIFKKFADSLKEEDIQILIPNEEKKEVSEEDVVYEKMLCKIKNFLKKFFLPLKEKSSVEIVFPKEDKHIKEISDISDIK